MGRLLCAFAHFQELRAYRARPPGPLSIEGQGPLFEVDESFGLFRLGALECSFMIIKILID